MTRALLRAVVAVSAAVLINGSLALGMAFWADLGQEPRRPQPARKPVEIPLVKAQPKRKPETTRRRSIQPDVARAALPTLDLPSAISVPVFQTEEPITNGVVHVAERRRVSALGADTILTEEMVDEAPRPIARAPLRYPKSAEANGVEGEVEARLLLSAAGAVLQVRILASEPPGVFESAARESLLRWRFSPATFRGQKLKAWVRQRVVFRLR
jgi:protein TonB